MSKVSDIAARYGEAATKAGQLRIGGGRPIAFNEAADAAMWALKNNPRSAFAKELRAKYSSKGQPVGKEPAVAVWPPRAAPDPGFKKRAAKGELQDVERAERAASKAIPTAKTQPVGKESSFQKASGAGGEDPATVKGGGGGFNPTRTGSVYEDMLPRAKPMDRAVEARLAKAALGISGGGGAGRGRGNWGHAGRPGERGGSA